MASTQHIFELADIRHSYNGRVCLALDGLRIASGTALGLAGPNGSGKSTLLRILAMLLVPQSGEVRYGGKPIRTQEDRANLRREVTLLLQEPYLLKRSVFANVAYGLKARGDSTGLEDRVREALALVNLDPDTFAKRSWRELSGGEAQRVALAARLALKPAVLLLDEPTSSLDTASSTAIRDVCAKVRELWNTTLVIASHDRDWLDAVCGDVLVMQPA